MALRIVEFFGFPQGHPSSITFSSTQTCPFTNNACIKPKHGACTVEQLKGAAIICCPNRLYAENYKILLDIAHECFGDVNKLILATDISDLLESKNLTGNEVVVFGRSWGRELPLPRPKGKSGKSANYYMDWILARVNQDGSVKEFVAVEVQTIDTTGNYKEQSDALFDGKIFTDKKGRTPGFSDSGMNWENVNKRILPQLIYKGHVLRREVKCSKGLYFVCPTSVLEKIRERLGGSLHSYHPSTGTITFRAYDLNADKDAAMPRALSFNSQFTTTVDQVALAFTSPMNLPEANVYEKAILQALKG